MGIIAKVLSFVRVDRDGDKVTDVKTDPGGGANITAEHFGTPGDDSHPLEGDLVFLEDTVGTGNQNAVGYIDPVNTPKASEGEKRIYSRDSSGNIVAEIWLKKDGSIVVSNENGSLELKKTGDINLNGVIIDPSGNMTAPTVTAQTSLKVGISELLGHTHAGVTVGTGITGPLI